LATDILAALDQQTVVVPGTTATETVLPKLAGTLKETLQQRKAVDADAERVVDDHPLSPVLTSMPGIGVRTAARILIEVGDGSAFPSAAHLAAYAGIAPVTRKPGSSIHGEHPAPLWQQETLTRPVPVRLRRPPRPHQSRLPRQKARREEKTQRGPDLPRPTPLRRSLRHAREQGTLPESNSLSGLTQTIGTPPSSVACTNADH
jgi:hypothetical protein